MKVQPPKRLQNFIIIYFQIIITSKNSDFTDNKREIIMNSHLCKK